MTDYIRYVDVDAAAGGNGTTNALTGANCAFKSLSLAEAAGGGAGQPPLNLDAGGGHTYTIICGSNHANHTSDTTAAEFSGWANALGRLVVTVDEASRHNGLWSDSKYRLRGSGLSVLSCNTSMSTQPTWIGLQAENTQNNSYGYTAITSSQSISIAVRKCLARTKTRYAFQINSSGASVTVENCIGLENGIYAQALFMLAGAARAINCTAYGAGAAGAYGAFTLNGASTSIKNCVSAGNAAADFLFTAGTNAGNNASEDMTADDSGGGNCVTGIVVADCFTNAAGKDFSLLSTATALINAGNATGAPTDDVSYAARSGNPDIGAWEYAAPPPVFKAAWARRIGAMVGGMN